MSIEKCALHADSCSSASEDVSKVNRKVTSILQTNSINKESKMGRNVGVLDLSLGDGSRPTSESTSLNSRFLSLLAHVLHDSWSLPSSIPSSVLLCLHRQWRLLQCGCNWRMNASFREEKHRLPDQCSALLVALRRSRTESQTTHRTTISRDFTYVVICRFSVLFHWCYHYGQKYTTFFTLLTAGPLKPVR